MCSLACSQSSDSFAYRCSAANARASSNLKTKDKDMAYQCKVCKQQFMCTAAIELMEQHVENKHKGKTYEDCFDWIYVAAPNMATVYKGSRAAHAAFGVCGRVYVYMCVYVCLCVCVCVFCARARVCTCLCVSLSLCVRQNQCIIS